MRAALGLIVPAFLAACSGSVAAPGGGVVTTRTFPVGGFDAVALQGADNVKVVTGPTVGVVASGPSEQIDKLDIRVEGAALKVGRKREYWSMNWGKGVTVTVMTPDIVKAAVAGSGNMSVDRVRGDKFEGAIGGSGDLDLADVQVASVTLSLAGSGDVRVTGTAQSAALSVAGSGNIDAAKLASQTADISIAGSGNVQASASKSAKMSLIGSGDARVKGTTDCAVASIGPGKGRCEL